MTDREIKDTVMAQLCADYHFSGEMLKEKKMHFTKLLPDDARRPVLSGMKALCLVMDGSGIICAADELLRPLEEMFSDRDPQWLFEAPRILDFHRAMASFPIDWKNLRLHVFFTCRETPPVLKLEEGLHLKWYEAGQMEEFRDTVFAQEALLFDEGRPDYLAAGALVADKVAGLAGASLDGKNLYQIGINVLEGFEKRHIASTLVNALTRELIQRGKVPFYDTAFSHIVSQKVALNAGFQPAWASLHANYLC